MLFLLFGSSAAGKTTALEGLRGRLAGLAVHDFDEIDVPPAADTAWRHRACEQWVRRALEYDVSGEDLLLAGQVPFGELLATPSAPRLQAISGCLLDCDDETQTARLQERGAAWFARSAGELQQAYTWEEWIERHLNWAEWLRRHAADPAWRTEVIRHEASENEMRWARWSSWRAGDPRWRVRVVDASARPADVVASLVEWIEEERALLRSGAHPLAGGLYAREM